MAKHSKNRKVGKDESKLTTDKSVKVPQRDKIAYELSYIGKLPKTIPYQPKFRHLTMLLQINNLNVVIGQIFNGFRSTLLAAVPKPPEVLAGDLLPLVVEHLAADA